jgi:hypothetical protein
MWPANLLILLHRRSKRSKAIAASRTLGTNGSRGCVITFPASPTKESGALAGQVQPVRLVRRVGVVEVVLLGLLAMLVPQELQDRPVPLVLRVRPVLRVPLERPVLLERQAQLELPGRLVPQERLALLGQQEPRVARQYLDSSNLLKL